MEIQIKLASRFITRKIESIQKLIYGKEAREMADLQKGIRKKQRAVGKERNHFRVYNGSFGSVQV